MEAARLSLRRWREGDAEALREALDASDAHLRPWIPFMQGEPRSLAATRERIAAYDSDFLSGVHYRYALWTKARVRELVGEAMLLSRAGPGRLELGYWIHVDHVAQGFAVEACSALVALAFRSFSLRSIIARCDVENLGSCRVAQKIGGREVSRERLDREVTLVTYSLTEEAFAAR